MGTKFAEVYNRFLGKITDDMYVELTPQDTMKDLQRLLVNALPNFEFPRVDLLDYTLSTKEVLATEIQPEDFIITQLWGEMLDDETTMDESTIVFLIDDSSFAADLSAEEQEILSILMMIGWTQRQVSSIENTRMKYSGSDFKMTSQANHLQKLLALLSECNRQSHHFQRLYKRRRFMDDGRYRSNWDVFNTYD